MSFESEFLTMMPLTITVYPFLGFDAYGEASYSTSATTYRCRVEYDRNTRGTMQGEELTQTTTVYVAAQTTLNNLDNYVLPDGSTGMVSSIKQMWDDEGIHHNVINFAGGPGG